LQASNEAATRRQRATLFAAVETLFPEVILPEVNSNVEYAHLVHEQGHEHAHEPLDRRHEWIAIAEAILLSIVAIATAWSGYQAAKWDAISAKHYAQHADLLMSSQVKAAQAGQDHLYDSTTFNGWMFASNAKNSELMEFYVRRFRPEYRTAFEAWMKLDPIHNPDAPAGPALMPEYKDTHAAESIELAKQAKDYFKEAVESRETGDQYVKVTVLLATVLLLTALSQRFKILGPRIAVVAVALVLLLISTGLILKLPRAQSLRATANRACN
jgi:hypothetical protein